MAAKLKKMYEGQVKYFNLSEAAKHDNDDIYLKEPEDEVLPKRRLTDKDATRLLRMICGDLPKRAKHGKY